MFCDCVLVEYGVYEVVVGLFELDFFLFEVDFDWVVYVVVLVVFYFVCEFW